MVINDAQPRVKRVAWLLSLAGLIPFAWFSGEVTLDTRNIYDNPLFALVAYGAVILSFLSGFVWMRALLLDGYASLSVWLLGMSVMPSLAGWAGLLIGGASGLLCVISGFVGVLIIEHYMTHMALIAPWFWRLRLAISAGAIICMVLAYCAVMWR